MRMMPLAVRAPGVYTEFKMYGVRAQGCQKFVRVDPCMKDRQKIKVEINGNTKI